MISLPVWVSTDDAMSSAEASNTGVVLFATKNLDITDQVIEAYNASLELRSSAEVRAAYLGEERKYHHTAPINMVYALHEGLLIVEEP